MQLLIEKTCIFALFIIIKIICYLVRKYYKKYQVAEDLLYKA